MQFALRGHRGLLALASVFALFAATLVAIGPAQALVGHSTHRHHNGNGGHKTHGGRCVQTKSAPWGTLNLSGDPESGKSVNLYTLSTGHRMKVEISNYGGVVQSIWVPDRSGKMVDVALGFPADQAGLTQYETMFTNPPAGGSGNAYFGAIIGRYANRIANHQFTLDGNTFNLVGNNGPNNINTLHGGPDAWNARVWTASPPTTNGCNSASLTLSFTDPGLNGFPGTVTAFVTYTLNNNNQLAIDYKATTSAPTVINLTNHSYFNLAGEGSGDMYNQLLAINADTFLPTDATAIPTGTFAPVRGTPFDFRRMKPIGRDIRNASDPQGDQLVLAHGYDHNWNLNGYDGHTVRLVSVAQDPGNGVTLWTYTDQPGVQLYTSNFLVGDWVGTSGHTYRQGAAFTLETQHYPDSPHHIGEAMWPSVVLRPGDTFTSKTVYGFSTTGRGLGHRIHFS